MQHEGDNYTNRDWCFWYSYQRIIKGTGGLGGWRTSGDHWNYSIVENSQNIEKSHWDLRFAVTQTPVKKHLLKLMWKTLVIYWPSTEPSIKRYTCVNKRKNRCTYGSSQLEKRCRSESQRHTEGFGPSVSHGWATPAKMRKKCCYGCEKNLGQYSRLSSSPTHLSLTTNITLSRVKYERYIFIRKYIRSFIEVHILCLIIFLLMFVLRLYNTFKD